MILKMLISNGLNILLITFNYSKKKIIFKNSHKSKIASRCERLIRLVFTEQKRFFIFLYISM